MTYSRNIILFLLIIPAALLLQIFLSRRVCGWWGLILPIISFGVSLLYVLNIADTGSLWQNTVLIVSTMLLANIPTLIFLAIYFVCRGKIKRDVQIKKMNIQDLE
ncbi:MAG: hypothetical protein EOM54_13600 [Clostridia bacterium]|nr:hypothetical protein [Clostridia bacterium]